MTDITSLRVSQASMSPHAQVTWQDSILLHSTQDGFTVQLKWKTSDILFTQEPFTESDRFHIKELSERLMVLRTLTHSFLGRESDTWDKRQTMVTETFMNGHMDWTQDTSLTMSPNHLLNLLNRKPKLLLQLSKRMTCFAPSGTMESVLHAMAITMLIMKASAVEFRTHAFSGKLAEFVPNVLTVGELTRKESVWLKSLSFLSEFHDLFIASFIYLFIFRIIFWILQILWSVIRIVSHF